MISTPPQILLKPGQTGTYSGFPATVVRHYDSNMYEVRVPGGLTCIDAGDFILDPAPAPNPAQEDPETGKFDIATTPIGSIKLEDGGSDQYLLLKRKDGDIMSPEFAQSWLLARVYREGDGAGSYFCHNVDAMQKPFSETECICIVQHRYDV